MAAMPSSATSSPAKTGLTTARWASSIASGPTKTFSACEPATAARPPAEWELAYRFSYIDMLDGLTTKGAGIATDHTLGLNWYLNPYTRVMFNYVHTMDTYNVSTTSRITGGNMDIFEMRLAMDF